MGTSLYSSGLHPSWKSNLPTESRSAPQRAQDEAGLSSLAVFEIFHLAQALLGRFLALVWAAQIFTLFGNNFVTGFHFFDHRCSPPARFSAIRKRSQSVDPSILFSWRSEWSDISNRDPRTLGCMQEKPLRIEYPFRIFPAGVIS
jgi:hypothetical protein